MKSFMRLIDSCCCLYHSTLFQLEEGTNISISSCGSAAWNSLWLVMKNIWFGRKGHQITPSLPDLTSFHSFYCAIVFPRRLLIWQWHFISLQLDRHNLPSLSPQQWSEGKVSKFPFSRGECCEAGWVKLQLTPCPNWQIFCIFWVL